MVFLFQDEGDDDGLYHWSFEFTFFHSVRDPLRGKLSLSRFTFDLTQSLQHVDRRPLDE